MRLFFSESCSDCGRRPCESHLPKVEVYEMDEDSACLSRPVLSFVIALSAVLIARSIAKPFGLAIIAGVLLWEVIASEMD